MANEVEPRLESPEVDERSILGFAGGFLGFVIVLITAFGAYCTHAAVGKAVAPPRRFPDPQLETVEGQQRARLEAERKQTESYAWLDRAQGRIRIPIARAMEIVAARGARAYDPDDPSAPTSGAP